MSVNAMLNAALVDLKEQRIALQKARNEILAPQQAVDNLTPASTQMERNIARMDLDQAINTADGAQLHVNRA